MSDRRNSAHFRAFPYWLPMCRAASSRPMISELLSRSADHTCSSWSTSSKSVCAGAHPSSTKPRRTPSSKIFNRCAARAPSVGVCVKSAAAFTPNASSESDPLRPCSHCPNPFEVRSSPISSWLALRKLLRVLMDAGVLPLCSAACLTKYFAARRAKT